MTASRARAYTRLVRAVRDGDLPLTVTERDRIVLAADEFLFASSWNELGVQVCLGDMRRLAESLLERWPAEPLDAVLDDLETCGPPDMSGTDDTRELLPAAA